MPLSPVGHCLAVTPTEDRDQSGPQGNSRRNRCRLQGSCGDVLLLAFLVCVAEIRRQCMPNDEFRTWRSLRTVALIAMNRGNTSQGRGQDLTRYDMK